MGEHSKSFERINQKKRTRRELLRSAEDLVGKGSLPSVADVADHAGISRATAYRYFSTAEDLLRTLVEERPRAEISIAPARPGEDPADRVSDLVTKVMTMLEADEVVFRALLAASIGQPDGATKGDRRAEWLAQALAPVEDALGKRDFRRLVMALGLTCGIETLVTLKDACGLKQREARDVVLWTVRTLVAGALGQGAQPADPVVKPGSPQLRFDLG